MSSRGPGRPPVFRQENVKRVKKKKVEGWVPEDLLKEFDMLCAVEFRKRSEQIALLISQAVEKAKAEGKLGEIRCLPKNSET